MKTLKATLLLLALSLPLWAAKPDKHGKHDHDHDPVAVPEGGEPIAYLFVSGAAILGVFAVRKRILSRSVR
jgi:hypothetical protein